MPRVPRQAAPRPTQNVPAHLPSDEETGLGAQIGTAAAVGIAAALIEVDLIPGILIGDGAMLAPKFLGSSLLRPLVNRVIRAGYSLKESTREAVGEASEQLQDMVAELRAEHETTESVAPPEPPHVTEEAAAQKA
jgi:hypothetical protein